MNQRILVTPRSLTAEPHPDVERLREQGFDIVYSTAGAMPTEEELLRLVPDCVGWLAGVEPVTPRIVEAAEQLKVISRNGVGIDNLPVDLLKARGVAIRIAEGANALGVAELTIGLMFSALRSIPRVDAGIKTGGWPRLRGAEIRGRTVGVVGCGAIGAKWRAWSSRSGRRSWPSIRRGPISTCRPAPSAMQRSTRSSRTAIS